MIERVAVPRRIADGVRRIVAILPRLTSGKSGRFGRTELMGAALDVMEAELHAAGKGIEAVRKLRGADLVVPGARAPSTRPPPVHRDVRGQRERRGAE